jgi:hypothetical protein
MHSLCTLGLGLGLSKFLVLPLPVTVIRTHDIICRFVPGDPGREN